MMNGMSFSETIFLFFLALIIFGPKKLPEIARQVGKYLNEFKRASNEFKAQIEQEIAHLEVENHKQTILPPTLPVEGTASRSLNSSTYEASNAEGSPSAEGPTSEVLTGEPPATLASVEPTASTSGNGSAPVATEAVPNLEERTQEVTSNTSQESHA
jgi:sec-independent protein translocase protein TatB